MPATPDGAPWGSVAEQREWFWLNFSQELARAKAACATDAERERLNQLRNGVKWLHNAIWQIHSIRPNAQPDDLNLAATELLLQRHRFHWLIPVDDMERLAAVHEQGFVAALAGLKRASFGLLCIELAEWHIEKLMAHRSDLSPRTPNPKTSHFANVINVQEGHCFYSRQDPATGLRVADCSPDDVRAVNAEFDANADFNFAGQVPQPAPMILGTTPHALQSSERSPDDRPPERVAKRDVLGADEENGGQQSQRERLLADIVRDIELVRGWSSEMIRARSDRTEQGVARAFYYWEKHQAVFGAFVHRRRGDYDDDPEIQRQMLSLDLGLSDVHLYATLVLMAEAEAVGIDSAPLARVGNSIRDLLHQNSSPRFYRVPGRINFSWPECEAASLDDLAPSIRESLEAGYAQFDRLRLCLGIRAAGALLPVAPTNGAKSVDGEKSPSAPVVTGTSTLDARNDDEALVTPKQYLSGWPAMLGAVGLKNNKMDKHRLLSLSELYDGPIPKVGRGKTPRVEKGKLVNWWNGLDEKFQASHAALNDKAATVEELYQHGRDETVVPGISGHVQKRRSTKN